MTREEAIAFFKDMNECTYGNLEAVDMAIKALKQQPCEDVMAINTQGYDIAGIKTWYIQIMCNKCGFIKTAIEGHTGQYNYCPNCGADMRGDEV